ncbi:MAG: 4Fe-4S binding protein [Candidatus Firestonebacteria bacterium]
MIGKIPKINKDLCTACGSCLEACEPKCLELVNDIAVLTKQDLCNGCGACADVCPVEAME